MKKILLTTLALAAAAAPAVADRGSDRPPADPPSSERADGRGPFHAAKKGVDRERTDAGERRGPKGTHHLVHACVSADATATGVELKVLGGNRHMRRALDGSTAFTAGLDDDTLIRLVGRARHPAEEGGTRRPRIGTYADLAAGDRVIVRFRAPRGTAAADLPAAFKVIDRGPGERCATPDPSPEKPVEGDDGSL